MRTFLPARSEGWTSHFIERSSRDWVSAMAGHKDELLFQRGTQQAWQWAQACPYIRWFTDGEQRYAKALWDKRQAMLSQVEGFIGALCRLTHVRHHEIWTQLIGLSSSRSVAVSN